MTINNFKQHIDTRLLERGLQYYQEGNILTIEQMKISGKQSLLARKTITLSLN